MRRPGIPATLLAVVFLGGCSRQMPQSEPSGNISLVPVTFPQWQKALSGYKGQIVVVDFWATWCAPCIERFPHIVQLHAKYGRRGIRFVSMDLDDKSDLQALDHAREFLVKHKAAFDNYRMDEVVPDAFEKLDLLGIPAVLIYDRDGKLRFKLTGDNPNKQYTNADVDSAVEQLLQEKS